MSHKEAKTDSTWMFTSAGWQTNSWIKFLAAELLIRKDGWATNRSSDKLTGMAFSSTLHSRSSAQESMKKYKLVSTWYSKRFFKTKLTFTKGSRSSTAVEHISHETSWALRVQIPLFAQFYFFINPSYWTSEEIFVLGPSRMIIFRSAKQVKMESKQCCRNPMSHIWRNKFQKAALACDCTAKTCIELLKLVWILKQYEWLKKPCGNGIRVKFTILVI